MIASSAASDGASATCGSATVTPRSRYFTKGFSGSSLTIGTRASAGRSPFALGMIAGLAVTSVLFGLAHLPFGQFPNWKMALMAAIAGLFYGWAYQRAGSVRAAAVTHALVVASWKVFFG